MYNCMPKCPTLRQSPVQVLGVMIDEHKSNDIFFCYVGRRVLILGESLLEMASLTVHGITDTYLDHR